MFEEAAVNGKLDERRVGKSLFNQMVENEKSIALLQAALRDDELSDEEKAEAVEKLKVLTQEAIDLKTQ